MGVILHFSPIWFPFAPPMFSVNHSHRTRRMGTQLIRYCCTVAAKIALYMVHPSSTPDGRYEVGIPNTLLTSQFAVGNCTKKKKGSNWDESSNFDLVRRLSYSSARPRSESSHKSFFMTFINEDGDHHIVPSSHQYAEENRIKLVSAFLLVLGRLLWSVTRRWPS